MGCYCGKLTDFNIKNTPAFIPDIKTGYVIKVYDGDTITIAAPISHGITKKVFKFSVRIKGIDCPEMRTKDENEKEIAIKAKEYVSEMVLYKQVELSEISFDKYGRILAEVSIKNINISDKLIEKRLAIEYSGKTKNPPANWKSFHEGTSMLVSRVAITIPGPRVGIRGK